MQNENRQGKGKDINSKGRVFMSFGSLPKTVRVYIFVTFFVSVIIVTYSISWVKNTQGLKSLNNFLLFLFVFLLLARFASEIFPIEYSSEKEDHAEITLSLAFTLLIAFIFNPLYSLFIVIVTELLSNLKKEWYKIAFNVAQISIVVGIDSLLFHSLYNYSEKFFALHNIGVITIVGIIHITLESFILFGLLSILNNKPFFQFLWENIRINLLEIFTLYPLGFLLIYLYTTNFWSALFLIPLFFAIYAASKEKVNIIHQTEDTLYALARIEDDKFPETMAHSERVKNLTELLCKKLGIGESDTTIIVKAAMLHDIGKISVPDFIIRKKDQLTQEEKKIIRNHPVKGAEILEKMFNFRAGVDFILHHHERWDGRGYPDGLKGKDIPIGSRIICITDSFDAMTSPRVYKRAKTVKDAIREIRDDIAQPDDSKQFDPEIAKVFCKMIEEIINDPEIMNNASKREKYFHPQARVE